MAFIKLCLQQFFGIDDGADGGDGVGAQMGTNQQGLGVIVADAADAGDAAFKFLEVILEFCTEGGVFDIMNLPLEAFFLAVQSHAAPLCAQMGMIIHPEENIQHTVLLTCYAKKTAHVAPPLYLKTYLFFGKK